MRLLEFGKRGAHLAFGFIFAQFEGLQLHIHLFKGANLIKPKSENQVMANQEQDVRNFHEKMMM